MNEQRKPSLSASERETIVLFDDESNECTIYSCSRPIMTKLDRLCKSNPDNYKLEKKDAYSRTYITDKRLISFRTPSKSKMTEEQKKARVENLKKAREKAKLG